MKFFQFFCFFLIFTMFIFQSGIIDVSENGLRIIVDDQNCFQAIAYIKNEIFSSFVLRAENATFRTSMAILAVCPIS